MTTVLLGIRNITATAMIADQPLDLKQLAQQIWNCEYNPRKFSALILRIRHPRITGLIFKTGKIVLVGTTSEQESMSGAMKIVKIIKRATAQNPKIELQDYHIENIVASGQVNFRINLEKLCKAKKGLVYYEPELFSPACKMRYRRAENMTALIFRSGKLIYTGTTSYSSIKDFHAYLSGTFLLRNKQY
jgi:transcription initiation factor TFIID TATA-box-binding protein